MIEGKLDPKVLESIRKQKNPRVEALFLNEEDFKGLVDPLYEINKGTKQEIFENKIRDSYFVVRDILKSYCDLSENFYHIVSLWIVGSYFHDEFPTYPYLFINAMKGSGKSRLLRLITYLSKDGVMLNSLTEAILFRTKGTLGVDEFEGITRKGSEALRELLNSAYKKGIKVKRMRKKKTAEGEEQVVEEFDVYRPIVLANINGIDDVLGDRCISMVLDKSSNPKFTKKMEIYEFDTLIQKFKVFPFEECRKCRVDVAGNVYTEWNTYVSNRYDTIDTIPLLTLTTLVTPPLLFKKLDEIEIDGRSLELCFPLLMVSSWFGEEMLEKTLLIFKELNNEKKKDDLIESLDVSLVEFVSQQIQETKQQFILLKEIVQKFREFTQIQDEWINERWMSKALKRLNLIKDKIRRNYGRLILLDIERAQEKIKMFR